MVLVGVLLAGVIGVAAPIFVPSATPSATASGDDRLAKMASPSPTRGLVYTGLSLGKDGSACEGVFEAKSRTGASLGCSHGPDPAPPGVDVRLGRDDRRIAADRDAFATARTAAAATVGSVGCIGDGVSGSRVQAIYAVAADRTDRSATVIPTIRSNYAPRVDWQFNQSAAETGAEAHVTFVTEAGAGGGTCQLSVPVVRLTAAGDDSFSNTVAELRAQGYNRKDRKYLVWADANVLCGVGSVYSDTRPGLNNLNNGAAAMFARVDAACWGHAEGHELMHTLGAVQEDAPHATANGHCYDEPDDMCYDDDGNGPATMVSVCTGRSGALFDCNHDDYFYAGIAPAGNWLATHWNTYNSNWLLRGPLPGVAVSPPPSDPTGGTAGTGGTGGTGGTTTNPTPTTTTTAPPVISVPVPPVGPVAPPPPSPVVPTPVRDPSGYWMLTSDGHVHPFGAAAFLGQPYPLPRGVRAVDLEPSPSGFGYWVLDDSGRVRAYGEARQLHQAPPNTASYGSVPAEGLDLGERAVSLSATPSGGGYWVFSDRGRAVPFGDAGFFGDVSGVRLNRPVVGSVATPSGGGYYMFASDGGIFTFGDARFFGSTGGIRLNKPVVSMAVAPGQRGYWLVGADGGLFAFGAADFYGSLGALRLNRPVSAVVPGRAGYLMVGEDGGAFSFGDVSFFGSLGATPPATPVVSVALRG